MMGEPSTKTTIVIEGSGYSGAPGACRHGSFNCEVCERDERIAELEADVARLRDYALADAYCPCCATSEGEHAEECDHETDRMRAARAALKGRG